MVRNDEKNDRTYPQDHSKEPRLTPVQHGAKNSSDNKSSNNDTKCRIAIKMQTTSPYFTFHFHE